MATSHPPETIFEVQQYQTEGNVIPDNGDSGIKAQAPQPPRLTLVIELH
jgi:hypothetical protein